jgi:hypothetical protein
MGVGSLPERDLTRPDDIQISKRTNHIGTESLEERNR